jgi:hypothetical protein
MTIFWWKQIKKLAFVSCALLLTSCAAQTAPEPTHAPLVPIVILQEENPYAQKPEDRSWVQAGIILTSLDLSDRTDITPARTQLTILGSMPSVCDVLRVKVEQPNPAYEIRVEIYSIENPNKPCENVFQQVETSILLGKYSAGEYSVWVNSKFVGNIVSYP